VPINVLEYLLFLGC